MRYNENTIIMFDVFLQFILSVFQNMLLGGIWAVASLSVLFNTYVTQQEPVALPPPEKSVSVVINDQHTDEQEPQNNIERMVRVPLLWSYHPFDLCLSSS